MGNHLLNVITNHSRRLAIAGLLSVPSAQAAEVTLNFSTEISFSPNTIVAAGGVNMARVLEQSFGIDSNTTSSFSAYGSLSYDSDYLSNQAGTVTSYGISGDVAAYKNPVTSLTITIAGNRLDADIEAINANEDSASSGFVVTPNYFALVNPEIGGASIQTIKRYYPDAVQTGNAALIGDNLPLQVTGPSGTTNIVTASDFIGFSVGTTAIDDFGAGFTTDGGSFKLSSAALMLVGNGSEDLFTSTTLPIDSGFYNEASLDTAIVALAFELENGFKPITLTADISSFDIQPNPVPVPAAIWLFGSSVMGLCLTKKRGFKH